MNIRTLIIWLALLAGIAGLLLSGCGGGKQSLAHLSAQDLFKLGKEKFDKKKYVQATEAFQSLVYNYPGEPIVDTAQYYLALSYYSNGDYELGQVEFNRLLVNYPTSPYATQAEFMRAASAFEATPGNYALDQSKLDDAIKLLEEFVIDHPESEVVPDANKLLNVARTRLAKKFYMAGVTYTRMGAPKAASIYYQKVIDDYTDTEFAPLANFAMAQAEMELHNYDDAHHRFDNFVTVFASHKLVSEAKKKAAEAAFKAAEAAYAKKDFPAAVDKFGQFKKDYPNDGRVRKADEYLAKINQQPVEKTPQANAESK